MDFIFVNNPYMDILKTISTNLTRWMAETPGLGTLEEVAAASKVGFGTVRRIKNCQVNPTIKNLELIASAFKKRGADLLVATDVFYEVASPSKEVKANTNMAAVIDFHNPDAEHPTILEALTLMRKMDDAGKARALKHIRLVAEDHIQVHKTNKEQ